MKSLCNHFNCAINEDFLYKFDNLEYIRALIALLINTLLHIHGVTPFLRFFLLQFCILI